MTFVTIHGILFSLTTVHGCGAVIGKFAFIGPHISHALLWVWLTTAELRLFLRHDVENIIALR